MASEPYMAGVFKFNRALAPAATKVVRHAVAELTPEAAGNADVRDFAGEARCKAGRIAITRVIYLAGLRTKRRQ